MAWITKVIYIDGATAEVLDKNRIIKDNYEIYLTQKIYNKINETHIERVIIKHCRPAAQQQLF